MKKLTLLLAISYQLLSISQRAEGQYTDLVDFNDTLAPRGWFPNGSLIISGTTLYGLTTYGGAHDSGVLFSVQTDGTNYTDLLDFHGVNAPMGAFPLGSLLLNGDTLYGMTEGGGANEMGVIFSVQTNGTGYRDIVDFNGSVVPMGANPRGSLILSGDTLYGMTQFGGVYGYGVIFKVLTNGTGYTDIFDFTNYAEPWGSLLLSGNTLYGMTYNGGTPDWGVVFSIKTNGTGYTNLVEFDYGNPPRGGEPMGSLILFGNTLYGMTNRGGLHQAGLIFSVQTNGTGYNEFVDFNDTIQPKGLYPHGSLILFGNTLYGMTQYGGVHNQGVIFSVNTNGTGYNDLLDFNGLNPPMGTQPMGDLLLSGHSLYGMTYAGGIHNRGVVFSFNLCIYGATITSVSNVKYNGDSNGSVTVTPSGGISPYTYSWNNGQTTATATGLSAGAYAVNITDSAGCTGAASVTITQPEPIGDSMSSTCATCCNCKGYTRDSAFGGTSPYTFLWSNGRTNDTLHSLVGGTYTCTVTDAHGCTKTDSVIVTQGEHLSPSSTNITCYGDNDGTATAEVSGNYDYSWSPGGQTTATITGLSAGSYMVTATNRDTVGCISTYNFIIIEPPLLQTSLSVNSGCNGGAGGSAVLSVSGGTPGYLYTWTPTGGNGSSANGLSAGSYTVTVTDANGCTSSASFSITIPLSPLSVTVYSETCPSIIGSSVSGGTPPYTYSWSYSYFGASNNLSYVIVDIDCGGNNSSNLTVTDNNGCTAYGSGSIEPPSQLQSWTTTNSCYGENNGSVTLNWCGGFFMTQYTYTLTPSGQVFTTTSPYTITGLAPGSYSIQFYLGGCIGLQEYLNFTITQSPQLSVSVSTVQAFCNTSATATVTGGTAPYTYSWSGGAGTNSSAYLTSIGTYTLSVRDYNGCSASAMVIITQAGSLNASAIVNGNIVCNGSSSGSATGTATGGSLPYTYLWSDAGSQTTATATGLSAGTYLLNITDSLGCLSSASVSISQPGLFNITGTRATAVTCTGGSNGIASVVLAGGTSPFTYLWNDANSQTTLSATGLSAGTYTIIVHDSCGSSEITGVAVFQPLLLSIIASVVTGVNCYSENSGQLMGIPSGGTSPYTYLWSDAASQTTASATGLSAGTYSIIVTDRNGCISSAQVTITQSPPLLLSADSINTTGGNCNGSAWATASGGVSPYTFNWSPGGGTTDTIINQCAGAYCCTITDANGCIDSICTNIETSTGTNQLRMENGQLTIYPNPCDGIFTVAFSHAELVSASQTIIEVYNVLGEKVYDACLPQTPKGALSEIDLYSQPDGVYFYRVINGDGGLIGEGKLVIQK